MSALATRAVTEVARHTRVCVRCGQPQTQDAFYVERRSGHGQRHICKHCELVEQSRARAGEEPVPTMPTLQRLDRLIVIGWETGRRWDALASAILVMARYDAAHHGWTEEADATAAQRWLHQVGMRWLAELTGMQPNATATVDIT